MKARLILIILVLIPLQIISQIPDGQISRNVEKYFSMNHSDPALVSAEISNDFIHGRTLTIKIIGNRNTKQKDLAFAFAVGSAVANFAAKPIEMLCVQVDVRYKGLETSVAIAPVACSVEAMVLGETDFETWWKDCLQFL
ncbi:MAG: hypothetical protein HQ507_01555 [Candidatus Marinimicrobia bacterium]|nr:hypothetical protein [Candidatus Neomarinimicrobiota bacterium]